MKKKLLTWCTAVAVMSSGTLVLAEDEAEKDGERRDRPEKKDEAGEDKKRGDGERGHEHPMAARIFHQLDKNEDGVLTIREFAEARPYQNASRKEVGEAFKKKDLNDDGEIGKFEFIKTFNPPGGPGRGGKGKGKGDRGDKGPPKGGKGGKGGKG